MAPSPALVSTMNLSKFGRLSKFATINLKVVQNIVKLMLLKDAYRIESCVK